MNLKNKNKLIVLRFKKQDVVLLISLIIFFVIIFGAYYFVKKQEKNIEEIKLNKLTMIKSKDDVYWRKLGQTVFEKAKKTASETTFKGDKVRDFQIDINLALSYFDKALELNQKSYDNHLALAEFYDFLIPYVSGSEKDSANHYVYLIKNFSLENNIKRQAVRILIINYDKAIIIGDNAQAKGSLKIAAELSKNLIQYDAINLYGKYFSALIARREKNFDLATTTLEMLKPFLNNEPDLYFELGQAYFQTNQFKQAKLNFEIAGRMSEVYKKNSAVYLRNIEELSKQKTSIKK